MARVRAMTLPQDAPQVHFPEVIAVPVTGVAGGDRSGLAMPHIALHGAGVAAAYERSIVADSSRRVDVVEALDIPYWDDSNDLDLDPQPVADLP